MKTRLIALALSSAFLSAGAMADGPPKGNSSFTIGAVQSDIALIDDASISGFNMKYQFEPDGSRVGFLGSFTYASGSDRITQPLGPSAKIDSTYFSIAVGPSYRLNRFAAVYGLFGFAGADAELDGGMSVNDYFAPVFGAGLRLNPTKSIVIDAHYEKAGIQSDRKHVDGDTYSVGLGLQF
jgi:putative virulence related protein PagC